MGQVFYLHIGNQSVEQVGTNCSEKYFKFVGHVLGEKLSWEGHVEYIAKKMSSANYGINSSKMSSPLKSERHFIIVYLIPT